MSVHTKNKLPIVSKIGGVGGQKGVFFNSISITFTFIYIYYTVYYYQF